MTSKWNTFFVTDMYKKLRFTQHPETKEYYLSVIPEDENSPITYDYLKVEDSFKTPSAYLEDGAYSKAREGYLNIQKQDSTSVLINESDFNELGYELIRKKQTDKAIEVFKINVALYPESDNVYDSLASAYLKEGDSLQAFNNYNKALELNTGNKRAKKFIEAFKKSQN
mgnify:CR=1 FL=1